MLSNAWVWAKRSRQMMSELILTLRSGPHVARSLYVAWPSAAVMIMSRTLKDHQNIGTGWAGRWYRETQNWAGSLGRWQLTAEIGKLNMRGVEEEITPPNILLFFLSLSFPVRFCLLSPKTKKGRKVSELQGGSWCSSLLVHKLPVLLVIWGSIYSGAKSLCCRIL